MRYFTRGWANGELDDIEHQAALDGYRLRLEEIDARLPESVRALGRDIHLHDALIERARWNPGAKTLTLVLVAGDDQVGLQTITLTYVGALLGAQRLDTLRGVARDRETEILYDEVDLREDGLLTHRLLFWPRDELTIDFRELRLEVAPRDDRRVTLGGAFIETTEDDG